MPHPCCVPHCNGNYRNGPKVQVFGFPRDEDLVKKWVAAIKRKDFTPTKHSKVCEVHFLPDDIRKTTRAWDPKAGKEIVVNLKRYLLFPGAIPSQIPSCTAYLSRHPSAKCTRLTDGRMKKTQEQLAYSLSASMKKFAEQQERGSSPEEAQDTASCPTPGCKGIGHVKGAKYSSHHSIFGCPYSIHNVNRSSPLVDRLAENSMVEETSIAVKIYRKPIDPSSVTPECLTRSDSLKQRIPGRIVGRPAKRSDDGVLDKTSRLLATTKPGRIFSSFGKYRLKGAKGKLFKRKRTLQETGTNGIDDFPRTSTTSSLVSTVPISPNLTSFRLNTKIPSDKRPRDSRVLSWTVSDVVQFVKGIGLSDHAHCFEEQQVDGEALFLLSQADIVRIMGIKLGPALKIYHALNRL